MMTEPRSPSERRRERRKLLYGTGKGRGLSTYSRTRIKGRLIQEAKLFYLPLQCYYCQCYLTEKQVTIDHKRPLSRNGAPGGDNVVIACASCNNAKGSLTDEEFFKYRYDPEALKEKQRVIKEVMRGLRELEVASGT